jgi:tetratricopeptide (TPR) repeat protein
MKRFLLTAMAILTVSTAALAQKSKIQSAILDLRARDLDKAKENIDLATTNPSSNTLAKGWYYKGVIYLDIAGDSVMGPTVENALEISLEAFQKAAELDTKGDFKTEIGQGKSRLAEGFFKQGLEEFEKKQFDKSLASFEKLMVLVPGDTNVINNAALSAQNAKNFDRSLELYNELLTKGYDKPFVHQIIAAIYSAEKTDTTAALKALERGIAAHPSDNGLRIDQLNIFLNSADRRKEAIASLEEATKLDPANAQLFFALGTLYESGKDLPKAVESYKKAIEINPKYFDALFNLGAVYFNEGAEMANEANKIPYNEQKKFEAAKAKYLAKFKEALPYLEKALDESPKDDATLYSLQQLYAKIGDNTKSAEMKKRRESAKK